MVQAPVLSLDFGVAHNTLMHLPDDVFFAGVDASKTSSGSTANPVSRAQLWRQAKQQRAADWARFNASRPDETYDAPEDLAALQHAAATVGDFKLKSSPGFMLPEVSCPLHKNYGCDTCNSRNLL